jgi:hypothetical protein
MKCGVINLQIGVSRCPQGNSTEAMTRDLYDNLRQLAGGRGILVPGCGPKFEVLTEPKVITASMQAGTKLSEKRSPEIILSPMIFEW